MQTSIYFVRHAQTDYSNPVDKQRKLTEDGLRDRYKVNEFFKKQNILDSISGIYASNYVRAIDTVRPLSEETGLLIEQISDFCERKIDHTDEDYFEISKRMWKDLDYKLEGGESIREVQTRNINALKKILINRPGDTLVIGSHGLALSSIINYYNPFFAYDDFVRIIDIKPWIVGFSFDGTKFLQYQEYSLNKR